MLLKLKKYVYLSLLLYFSFAKSQSILEQYTVKKNEGNAYLEYVNGFNLIIVKIQRTDLVNI